MEKFIQQQTRNRKEVGELQSNFGNEQLEVGERTEHFGEGQNEEESYGQEPAEVEEDAVEQGQVEQNQSRAKPLAAFEGGGPQKGELRVAVEGRKEDQSNDL